MDKIRNSSLLKMISYILIPILVAILGFSVFHLAFLNEYGDIGKETEYIQSEQFANNYFYSITNQIAQCEKDRKGYSSNYIEIEESNGNVYYYCDARQNTNYYMGIPAYMNYIIIHKETKKMYTNIKSNDYQKEMENMRNNKLYWNLVEGKIETNLEYLNPENIKYNYNYVYQMSNEEENGIKDYDVYTSYDNSNMNIYTAYGIRQAVYEYMLKNRNQPIHRIIISTLGLVAIAVYLFWAIGHKEGTEEIDLNSIDKIPYEIVAMSCLIIISIFLSVLVSIGEAINYMILFVEIICYFVCYAACAIMGVTTIKRIKAKQFWRSFLTYKIIQWCWDKTKKLLDTMKQKATGSKKIFWYYIFFLVMSVLIMSLFRGGIAILLLGAFWIGSYYQIKKYGIEQDKIKNALKNIYEGKTDIRLNEEELTGVLKEMAIYVNDIAGGFRNAIQENLKSERLKTELITNVSHDIKTPLTSIINYVDLLKKEEIPNEKIKEYIEILNQKSQRLKKLTEDLVEASKVSSGNVKLEIEEIDIKELLNQTIGEFKDKFENKKLKIEMRMPESPSKIKADNRYMYRVIENLFSNITKYALDGSRVYIDIKENNQLISICIKNISKDKLNISSDELMQRFVRGDKSRYTEGSGLGLSIAKSLTQLQGGKFDITIDGDLFRVDMEWKKS
ncbi:MAG: HAMP domain-containing histidine kinase [Clostridia bacterium]|nr:HAMP domain-containing histidine kinase [Clostridia bacterium]